MPPLASSLTATGVFWACISLAAALLSCAGFYLPYWIKGTLSDGTEVSFGSFRRCNYPRLTAEGKLEMVHECGRYTSFPDIPSVSWQVTTVTVGIGAAISLLVAFTALSACCLADVVTKTTARILGLIQLIAALLMATGCCIYPNGWTSREVKEVCGPESDAYRLGDCSLSWSVYLLCSGVGGLLLCVVLSLKASRVKPHSYRIWQPRAHLRRSQNFEMQIHPFTDEITTVHDLCDPSGSWRMLNTKTPLFTRFAFSMFEQIFTLSSSAEMNNDVDCQICFSRNSSSRHQSSLAYLW